MKLIWHTAGLLEDQWLRMLFSEVITGEILDPHLEILDEDAIHVVSSNDRGLSSYENYFSRLNRSKKNVLIHLSDEWYSGGYKTYRHFDVVYRNYWSASTAFPGIFHLPLGYPKGTPSSGSPTANQFVWSFVGEIKSSRHEMIAAMRDLTPNKVVGTTSISKDGFKLNKSEYLEILGASTFCPCPMGNVNLETWRMYESLELGCIPLLEQRKGVNYFDNLLGRHPLPSFSTWADAACYVQMLMTQKTELAALSSRVHHWWDEYKESLRQQVIETVTGPSFREHLGRFAERRSQRMRLLYEPARLRNLLQHQSPASLGNRLKNPVGPVKRIVLENLRWR